MNFVHLHTHSHYSLLDGLAKVDELVNKAKACGMTALALTDHGVMYGAIEFYQRCKKAGIKPIIGLEAYLAPNGHLNKRPKIDELRYHLILLAKNNTGYKNLIKLTSIAHLDGFYYKPRIDWELLEKHHEGLIACTACLNGEVPRAILSGDHKKTEEIIEHYKKIFGVDFYLEMQDNPGIPEQQIVNRELVKLSEKFGVPLVATNDTHYLNREDDEAHDVLLCLQTKHKKDDVGRMSMLGEDFSFKTTEQMAGAFAAYPAAIANTQKIADECNVEIELGKIKLPNFVVPGGKTADEYLTELAKNGLARRYGENITSVITERLNYELGVIKNTGFASYFLIVADFVNWAKNNGIVVGPGRGSAAGSLVSYLVNITNIDPLRYDLLFERFLNPERISMPDIDLDFADTRRAEVIRYVEQKYGKDHVAQIITFGTMAARVAIRDVGRVMNLPYGYCDKVAKLIPMSATLDEAMAMEPELKAIYQNDVEGKKLIDTAKKLEGVCRHSSTHACGVLITPEPLTEYVPVQYSSSGDEEAIVSQYSLHPIEDLGLLKMDFLGLKNLTILEQTIEIIEKIHAQKIDLDNLPLEDKKTFSLLQKGLTTGVFQLESSGMKRYLKQLKPTELEDIIAMVSLYRPGPMELIPDFIARKHGKKAVTYLHQKLEPILKNTYGIGVYQEQMMRIARDLAGFTLAEADTLRKAIGKKNKELLDAQEEKIISGMAKNGISNNIAKQIWELFPPFAKYGFNRSHAACYAMIAYQTAYFKANYPVEFMASLLTSDLGNMDRVIIEVDECAKMGVEVLPPDLNESYSTFTAVAESLKTDNPRIRFGLLAIKNLGEGVVKEIISEKKRNGPYKSFEDFLARVKSKDLNKKSLESLAKSGALDSLVERNQIIHNIDRILRFVKTVHQEEGSSQSSLFGVGAGAQLNLQLEHVDTASRRECLSWEKEFLGIYVSGHPYKEFEKRLSYLVTSCSNLMSRMKAGEEAVRVAGVVTTAKKVYTRAGEPMLFVRLEDTTGAVELIVFPKIMQSTIGLWQEENVIIVEGCLSDKDGETKLVVNKGAVLNLENLEKITSEYQGEIKVNPFRGNGFYNREPGANGHQATSVASMNKIPTKLTIKFSSPPTKDLADRLKNIFNQYPGELPVYLVMNRQGKWQKIETPFSLSYNQEAKEKIEELVGWGSVKLDV